MVSRELLFLGLIVGGGLVLLVLVGVAVYLLSTVGRRGTPQGNGPSLPESEEDPALRILRERYARGEIDAGEYEKMRRVLINHEQQDS